MDPHYDYQPRFSPGRRISRVTVEPLGVRNPLLGITELQTAYADVEERKPDWIAIPTVWAERYLLSEEELERKKGLSSPRFSANFKRMIVQQELWLALWRTRKL
ncbi:hypothetical protein BCY86_05590 [Pajaroellobacter abortibovis]|uniref:Uncharacterized protein n=2 Tax=Pajaroellobacter abortibovis TaxID=1882918 RepID=A0A1L6MXB0_9BACT|nr:hypothetical protein BCY86_05590 [Pajaroellobacter abortibovis]